jgi:hypothetical protein
MFVPGVSQINWRTTVAHLLPDRPRMIPDTP